MTQRPIFSAAVATPKIVLAILGCELVGALGTLWSLSGARAWYGTLILPPWGLAAGVFGSFWLLIYALMGAALGVVWAGGVQTSREKRAVVWLGSQLALGVAWNAVFFGMRSASWSYALIILLWLCAAAALWLFSKISRVAGWLLVPCLLWITFASALNFAVLSLNFLKPAVQQMDNDPRNGPNDSKPGATSR